MARVTYTGAIALTQPWADGTQYSWSSGVAPVLVPDGGGFDIVPTPDARLLHLSGGVFDGMLLRLMGPTLSMEGDFDDISSQPFPLTGEITGFRLYDRYEDLLSFDDANDAVLAFDPLTETWNSPWDGQLVLEVKNISIDAAALQLQPDLWSALLVALTEAGDTIIGSDQSEFFNSGGGNDSIVAGEGQDTVYAGNGGDTVTGGVGRDQLFGEAGNDNLSGEAGDDYLYGGSGEDTLSGGNHKDWLEGEDGNDSLYGGDDNDTILAGAGDDVTLGDAGRDYLLGDVGRDTIQGGEGHDTIDGGHGKDQMFGDDGDDYLYGGASDDTISGGEGDDFFQGGTGHDLMTGDAGADLLYGEDDNDTLKGGAGDDELYGGIGADTLSGEAGNDYLSGERGTDVLNGGAGNDTLSGDNGRDTLNGGLGTDHFYGGNDADLFVFGALSHLGTGAARDVIFDFSSGSDVIDLSGIDAILGNQGNDAFIFIGTAGFSSAAGELRFTGQGILTGDVDGDGLADFQIAVTGTVLESDLIL